MFIHMELVFNQSGERPRHFMEEASSYCPPWIGECNLKNTNKNVIPTAIH
jgi:hypothetical protein